MPRRSLIALALSLVLVIVLPALGQSVAPTASEEVGKDAPRATPAGATFTAPAGWTMTTKGSMVLLAPPEPDSRIAIVEVKAKDADAAVAAGWAAYKPGFKRPLKIALPQGSWGYTITADGADLRRLTTDGICGNPSWGR